MEEYINTNEQMLSENVDESSQSEHTGVTSTQIKKQPPWSPLPVTNPPDTHTGTYTKN